MTGLSDDHGEPLSNDYIRRQALTLRYILGVENDAVTDVARILEHVLPEIAPGFLFRVVPDGEIGGDGALTSWGPPCISLEETVYLGLASQTPRYRFTGLHELGHLILHGGRTQARNTQQVRNVSARHSLERQANRFAVEFALPHAIIKDCKVPLDVAKLCKVSVETAERRMRELGMWPRGDERRRVSEGFERLLRELRTKKG